MSKNAADVIDSLTEGTVIRVPQYENALKVTYVGDQEGPNTAFIGIEFVERPTNASKSLIQNAHSGRVYLVAGTSDKGEVKTIEVVSRPEQ